MRRRGLLAAMALAWAAGPPLRAQQPQPAAGTLLVASRKSQDPDLAQSVILLVRYQREGAIGLIVNRPSKAPLSEVFPALKGTASPVYAGGPIAIGIRALFRSRAKPEEAVPLVADVFLTAHRPLIERLAAEGTPPGSFRVYAGYAGWSIGQLRGELARGLWYVLPGEAALVFDPHPETLWPRLIRRGQPPGKP